MNLKRTLKGTPKTPKKSQEYPKNLKRTLKGTPKIPGVSHEPRVREPLGRPASLVPERRCFLAATAVIPDPREDPKSRFLKGVPI